jgi:hypothetical protein
VACTLSCDGESEGDGDGGSSSGGESTSGGGSNGGNGGNPTGGSDTGGTSGGGSSNGGNGGNSTGGSETGGTSGTGGSDDTDCSGAFGTPRTVLEIFDMQVSALTLSPDELELIYNADTLGATGPGLYSARRASKTEMFSNPVGLPELDAACTSPLHTRSGDLSFDGLTFYFACYLSTQRQPMPLRVARRTSLDAPFVLDPEPLGELIAGPSVSRDELELFSALDDVPVMRLGRDDISEPFGPAEPVAGFEMLALATPEIAANGRDIFVSQTTTGGSSYGIAKATRSGPSAAFGPLEWVLPENPEEVFRSPAISNDCRSLYYVNERPNPRAYRVDVVTR